MARHTSRGELRKAGWPSNKSVLPKAQIYITVKVGRREIKGNRTIKLRIFGTQTHTHTHTFSKRIQTKNDKRNTQKKEIKQPTKKNHMYFWCHRLENIKTVNQT